MLFDSPVRELSKHGVKFDLEVTDDVTGQVKVKMFDFSGLGTSASTISMSSANKANHQSAWMVSLHGWRNRGGGERKGLSPPGPINSISWMGPGGTECITKMVPFHFSWIVFKQLQ